MLMCLYYFKFPHCSQETSILCNAAIQYALISPTFNIYLFVFVLVLLEKGYFINMCMDFFVYIPRHTRVYWCLNLYVYVP